MRLLRALRYECFQMFFTKRWWVVPALAALLSGFTVSELQGYEQGDSLAKYHLAYNAWDVVSRTTQTFYFLAFLAAPLFVYIVGESYLRDRSSNTMPAIFSRVRSRATWWAVKVLSMFIGAFVYMVLFSLISLVVSSFFYPFAWHFSSFQLHPDLAQKALAGYGGSELFKTIPGTTPLLFLLHMWLYSTLSFGTYAVVALVISLRVHKPGLPTIIMLGLGMLEFNILNSSLWIPLHSWLMQMRLSYLTIVNEYFYFHTFYTLPTSILYYLVLSVLFWLIGDALVQHDDL